MGGAAQRFFELWRDEGQTPTPEMWKDMIRLSALAKDPEACESYLVAARELGVEITQLDELNLKTCSGTFLEQSFHATNYRVVEWKQKRMDIVRRKAKNPDVQLASPQAPQGLTLKQAQRLLKIDPKHKLPRGMKRALRKQRFERFKSPRQRQMKLAGLKLFDGPRTVGPILWNQGKQ